MYFSPLIHCFSIICPIASSWSYKRVSVSLALHQLVSRRSVELPRCWHVRRLHWWDGTRLCTCSQLCAQSDPVSCIPALPRMALPPPRRLSTWLARSEQRRQRKLVLNTCYEISRIRQWALCPSGSQIRSMVWRDWTPSFWTSGAT